MFVYRLIFPNIIFILVSVIMAIYALTTDIIRQNVARRGPLKKTVMTDFKQVVYFSVVDKVENTHVIADILKIVDKEYFFTMPTGTLHNTTQGPVNFSAKKAQYYLVDKELKMDGEVKLDAKDANHSSETMSYNSFKQSLAAKGDVYSKVLDPETQDNIEVHADELSGHLGEKRFMYLGHVNGKILRQRAYEEGLSFESKSMEINLMNSLIRLEHDVKVNRTNARLSAQKADIWLENYNKKLKYLTLYDDIKMVEKLTLSNGKVEERRAFAEKLESFTGEGKTILTGAPRVEQGSDVIKGYQITLRENVEVVEVDDAQTNFSIQKEP